MPQDSAKAAAKANQQQLQTDLDGQGSFLGWLPKKTGDSQPTKAERVVFVDRETRRGYYFSSSNQWKVISIINDSQIQSKSDPTPEQKEVLTRLQAAYPTGKPEVLDQAGQYRSGTQIFEFIQTGNDPETSPSNPVQLDLSPQSSQPTIMGHKTAAAVPPPPLSKGGQDDAKKPKKRWNLFGGGNG